MMQGKISRYYDTSKGKSFGCRYNQHWQRRPCNKPTSPIMNQPTVSPPASQVKPESNPTLPLAPRRRPV